MSLSWVL